MDEKFNRRFVSFTKSLDALAEARERDPFRLFCAERDQC